MIHTVTGEKELEKANRIGKYRFELGQIADPILYRSEKANLVMRFDGVEYSPAYLVRDFSMSVGVKLTSLEKAEVKPDKDVTIRYGE